MKKVREGYKEYEFGVIPNDWQVKKLGDIAEFEKKEAETKEKLNGYLKELGFDVL